MITAERFAQQIRALYQQISELEEQRKDLGRSISQLELRIKQIVMRRADGQLELGDFEEAFLGDIADTGDPINRPIDEPPRRRGRRPKDSAKEGAVNKRSRKGEPAP